MSFLQQEYWATTKLYIKDFNKDLEEEQLKKELRETFSAYGNITDIKIVKDKDTKAYKGYGFIDFDDEDPVDRFNCKLLILKHILPET